VHSGATLVLDPAAEAVEQPEPTIDAGGWRAAPFRTRALAIAAGAVFVAAVGYGALKMLAPASVSPVAPRPTADSVRPNVDPAGRGQQPQTSTAPPVTASPNAEKPPAAGLATTFPVTIDAVPWANVEITRADQPGSEAKKGATPFVVELPAGDYSVRLSNPLAPRAVTQRITIAAGGKSNFQYTIPGLDPDKIVQEILSK
jgi:hypothetical protein